MDIFPPYSSLWEWWTWLKLSSDLDFLAPAESQNLAELQNLVCIHWDTAGEGVVHMIV